MNNYDQTSYFGYLYPESTKAIIMVHGNGQTSYDIVNALEGELPISDFYTVAPNANGNNWYPNDSFAPIWENEPFFGNSLKLLKELLSDLLDTGFKPDDVYFLGFSAGASLVLEFVARNAQRFGGIYAFSGALPGDKIETSGYCGNFKETPIFLSCHEKDNKILLKRVNDTAEILSGRGALVYENIFPDSGPVICKEEISAVAKLISGAYCSGDHIL